MEKHITVDTSEMARKMQEVSETVAGTTAAVGLMHEAVIEEEKTSTDLICNRLTSGFYFSTVAQVEQKAAHERSNSKSLAMALKQQMDELDKLKSRMEKDYHRIAERYTKLFNDLNSELKNRIYELDRPVMEFCLEKVKLMQQRVNGLVSSVPVNQSESLTATQMITAAHLKENAKELINAITTYIKKEKAEQKASESIRQQDSVQQETVYYLPYILCEETNLQSADHEQGFGIYGSTTNNIRYATATLTWADDKGIGCVGKDNVPTERLHKLKNISNESKEIPWTTVDEETRKRVEDNFRTLVQNASLSKRVEKEMLKLFQKNAFWKSLKEDRP